jgi:uncharacterized protein (DUF362 family)
MTVPQQVAEGGRVGPGAASGPRLYLTRLDRGYLHAIREAFQWIGPKQFLRSRARVFVKPNLTFPVYRRGVMTSPECIEAVVIALKDYTDSIVVGEADSGGYNRFSMDHVFSATGILDLERRYGAKVVNLSKLPSRDIEVRTRWRRLSVPLPSILLDDTDLLITVPVPKVHTNTGVSLCLKNQWGCIPEPRLRLRLHPYFESVVAAIAERLRPAVAVVDGRYGLNGSGPMRGSVVDLNWLLACDDIFAAERACVRLLGIDAGTVRLLRFLSRHTKHLPQDGQMVWSTDPRPFTKTAFRLNRAWTDFPGLWAFRSRLLTWLAYYSPLAAPLHRLLYLVREPFYDYDDPQRTAP